MSAAVILTGEYIDALCTCLYRYVVHTVVFSAAHRGQFSVRRARIRSPFTFCARFCTGTDLYRRPGTEDNPCLGEIRYLMILGHAE